MVLFVQNTEASFWGRIHRGYQAPRALGMGDAFVAVADDYSTLFYNPAGLARIQETQVNLSMDFAATTAFGGFASELDRVSKITDPSLQSAGYIELFQKNYGEIYGGRFGGFHGVWVNPGWGFAIIPVDTTIELTVRNQAFPALGIRNISDTTFAFGYGARVKNDHLGGKLDWGVTAKATHRLSFDTDLNVADLVIDSTFLRANDMARGIGFDADFGLLYTPFLGESGFGDLLRLARPTFGLVVRNILGGSFTSTESKNASTGKPLPNYRVIDIGTKWEYPDAFIFAGRGVMDFRNILHPQYSFKKGMHLGFEFDWRMASWWKGQYQVGLSQGYMTAGFSALFSVFRLDLVTFGEEVGTDSFPRESRSFMARFNMDF